MRIGIYNPRVGTKSAGGTETFLRQFIKRCPEPIDLFTGDGELLEEIQSADVTCHQVPIRYKEDRLNELAATHTPVLAAEIESISMFCNAFRTGAIDRLKECDAVSTHYYADNALVSRFVDVPHLFRFPGIKQPSVRWRAMFAVDNTDMYVANSRSTADRLTEWFDIDVEETVYAGVDVDQFVPDNRPADDEFVVLFVGRLDDGKGVPDLIRAVTDLDVSVRIVGDGNRRAEFESLAHELLPADRYEFVGEIPHDEIHCEYQAADAFCLPSHHESFGIVVVEALACGLPVVTTRIDAIEEYIDHKHNGLLFEPGNVSTLRNHLRRIDESESLRNRLGANGRKTAMAYSWEAQTEKMTNAYRKVSER